MDYHLYIENIANILFFSLVFFFLLIREKIHPIEWFLILVHLAMALSLNGMIDPNYMPDQFGYLEAINRLREFEIPDVSTTVLSASFLFSIIPVPAFNSLTVLSIINFTLFLWMYLYEIRRHISSKLFRVFFLLYPSLMFYSSLAVRDTLIILSMYILVTGAVCIQRNKWTILGHSLILVLIKPQNAALIFLLFIGKEYLEITLWKKILIFPLIIAAIFGTYPVVEKQVDFYRHAMYMENKQTGDSPIMLGDYASNVVKDGIYFLLKPLPSEASNIAQLIQSLENIGVFFILAFLLINQFKRDLFNDKRIILLNFFFAVSIILYGYVVFNFGTAARYRSPFVVCYVFAYQIIRERMMTVSYNRSDRIS